MTIVNFYDEADDALLRFAVIIATSEGKYVFCKHKSRDTLEVPRKGNCTRKQERLILI